MAAHNEHQAAEARPERPGGAPSWHDLDCDFVMVDNAQPPRRIEMARERLLMCRLYIGLIRTLNDDYGTVFAQNDSATYRTIGIYVFLRTVMCAPVPANRIAQALKMPRATVLRRLQDMVKQGYVERVGNAYRVTDKVNIPDLQQKLQQRIAMITDTAKKLAELSAATDTPPVSPR
jgi:DNA-binding MarR family transcriptional regulator